MKTVIKALGTANPPMYVPQEQALAVLESTFEMQPAESELYRSILRDGPIRGRFIGMDRLEEAGEEDQDILVDRFLRFGRKLAQEASEHALDQAEKTAKDIGGLIVNTCTGYLCPGLSSYVAESLGLDRHVRIADLMGMGCGGAVPNLEAAANMLARKNGTAVLSIAVEICSSTLFMDPDPGVIVSNSIFGDGAAAALVDTAHSNDDDYLVELLDFESGIFPEHRGELQYRTEKHRLRNVLTRRVPIIAADAVEKVVSRLLSRHDLVNKDVKWWAMHPGGTAVLDRVGAKLKLKSGALHFARSVFETYGNMSSPSVLFVLKRILEEGKPKRGDIGIMTSFGAGFSAHAILLKF